MRKLIGFALAVIVVLSSETLMSAIPQVLNYQGILRDAGGVPVGDGNHSVTFRFYDAESGGSILWEEAQTVTTKAGLFSVLLGSVNSVPEIAFDGQAWLGITVGADPEMTPLTRVASVGYAYHSLNSEKLQGLGPDELVWPSTPATVFRTYKSFAQGQTVLLAPSNSVRQITGIYVSSGGAGGVGVSFLIDGTVMLGMFTGSGLDAVWTSNGGAPIQVGPMESLTAGTGIGTVGVLITGFEY